MPAVGDMIDTLAMAGDENAPHGFLIVRSRLVTYAGDGTIYVNIVAEDATEEEYGKRVKM
jgi:hypothetical protein